MVRLSLFAGIGLVSAVHLRLSPWQPDAPAPPPAVGAASGSAPEPAGFGSPLIAPSCSDTQKDWQDSSGRTCVQYHENGWCTPDGGYGLGWQTSWGLFSLYGGADQVCCVCGGGNQLGPPVQALSCEGTCAQAKLIALQRINVIVKSAIANLKKAIDSAGANATNKAVNGLNVTMSYYREIQNRDSTKDRTEMLAASRGRFIYLTGNFSSVQASSRKVIAMEGFKAAKQAVDVGEGMVDETQAQVSAYNLYMSWRNVTQKWETAHEWTKTTLDAGWQDWSQDEGGIMSVHKLMMDAALRSNQVLVNSSAAGKVMRWSQQVGSLASQLGDLASNRSTTADVQVAMAEDQSKKARAMTDSSTALLKQVEALVQAVEIRADKAEAATKAPVI